MEFLRTPLWHTAQGCLPCFLTGAELLLLTITLVLPMFTLSRLLSMPSFHSLSLTVSSSMVLAMITRSSAYSSSHGHPVLNSMERASSTMTNSRGLKTEPWCTPTLTSKGSLNAVPTLDTCTSIVVHSLHCSNQYLRHSQLTHGPPEHSSWDSGKSH